MFHTYEIDDQHEGRYRVVRWMRLGDFGERLVPLPGLDDLSLDQAVKFVSALNGGSTEKLVWPEGEWS